MSTILNDRDVLLQAASPRYTALPGPTPFLFVTGSHNGFKVDGAGTPTPATVTMTANLLNIPGNVTWSVTGATSVTPTGNTATLAYANMTANLATVTATITFGGTVYTHSFPVAKVQVQGSDIPPASINLSTHVTGSLANSQVTGLGALALLGSVNANTQVTNLGSLAFANSIAANLVGAGTLAAGVIYAGSVNANNITAGTITAAGIDFGSSDSYKLLTATPGSGVVNYRKLAGYNISCGNLADPTVHSLTVISSGTGSAVKATANWTATNSYAIHGSHSSSGSGVYGENLSSGPGVLALGTSGNGLKVSSSTGNAISITGGANSIVQAGGGANWLFNTNPATDGAYSLGTSGAYRWSALYANSSVITTSDERTKTEIAISDLGLSFIDTLRPVKYKQIVSENVVTFEPGYPTNGFEEPEPRKIVTPKAGTRFHYGFIAQEVRQAMQSQGVEDAAFWSLADPQDPDSGQALRYEELIAPLTRAVQELSQQNTELAARIAILETNPG